MKIEVYVDMERVADGQRIAWWATAPAIGNLSVAADSLVELETLARNAIDEILEERGGKPAEVLFRLRDDAPPSAGAERAEVEYTAAPRDPASNLPTVRPSTPETVGLDGRRAARELVPA